MECYPERHRRAGEERDVVEEWGGGVCLGEGYLGEQGGLWGVMGRWIYYA